MTEYLTVREIIKILKVSRPTAYSLVRSGNLRSFKVGRLVRIKQEDLIDFIEGRPHRASRGQVRRRK